MEILSKELKNTLYNFIKTIKHDKKEVFLSLAEYKIAPKIFKNNYIYSIARYTDFINDLDKIEKTSDSTFLDYILRIKVLEKNEKEELYVISNLYQIKLIELYYNNLKNYSETLIKQILSLSNEIYEKILMFNIANSLKENISHYELTNTFNINLHKLITKYKSLTNDYRSIILKCERLIEELEKIILQNNTHHLPDKKNTSIIAKYLNHINSKNLSFLKLYNRPIHLYQHKINQIYIKDIKLKEINNINNIKKIFAIIPRGLKRAFKGIALFFLKMIADTIVFLSKTEKPKIKNIKELISLKLEISHLRLNYLEIINSSLQPSDVNLIDRNKKHYENALYNYSLYNQDSNILKYVEKPPLSFTINKKKFSLLNGISLSTMFLAIVFILSLILITALIPKTKLNKITETAKLISHKPDIHAMSGGESTTFDDIILSSLADNGLTVDEKFLSEIKLSTSFGIEKQKDIKNNIIQQIRNNEEHRNLINFSDELKFLSNEFEKLSLDSNNDSETSNTSDITETNFNETDLSNENNKTDINENEALSVTEPMSLPDYSKYSMEIKDHNLDLSIQNKKFTINEFKPAIIKLNNRFVDWYEQTEKAFFPKYEKEYAITKEHQQKYLEFIKKLSPIKIFEAFNYQFQNFPYLLDRLIKSDMPIIYTAISTDIKEFGIWRNGTIGIFYDLSSFDVFQQVLVHEMTHDLIQRAYGTPIILEGITEMLAMNIISYISGEEFSKYRGAVRTAQYLYNRNPKALIDYYIGRRKDGRNQNIDLFDKQYIIKNFLNDEVHDDIATKNTELISSMLEISFDDLIKANRTIIPFNEIINTHKDNTPLVLQTDFNYKGLTSDLLEPEEALNNLDYLIIPRLNKYINAKKKIDIYTILIISETILNLQTKKEEKKLSDSDLKRLNKIKEKFEKLQEIISKEKLIYEQNQLSEKSLEILKENFNPTYSDKEHQETISNYTNNEKDNTPPVIDDFKDYISNDETELIENSIENQMKQNKNDLETNYDLSEEELEEIKNEIIKKDIDNFSNSIKKDNLTPEQINKEYSEILKKWGPEIKKTLDDELNKLGNKLNKYDINDITKLPNNREILEQKFNLMEETYKKGDTKSPHYKNINDNIWSDLLSKIDKEEYIQKYYELLLDNLLKADNNEDIEKTLTNLKKIVSYLSTIEFFEKYKKDLKNIISTIPLTRKGISKISMLNKYMKGTLHTFIKNEILSYLEDFIDTFINSYPKDNFSDIFASNFLRYIKSPKLYKIIEKALDTNINISFILDNLSIFYELYSKLNLSGLTEKFIELYLTQVENIINDYPHQYYLNIIFKTEKMLIELCGRNNKDFIHSTKMSEFYKRTYEILKNKLIKLSNENYISKYLNELSYIEKYIAYFFLSITLSKYTGDESYKNFYRTYKNIFLDELNLHDDFSKDFLQLIIGIAKDKNYANTFYSVLTYNYDNKSAKDDIWDPKNTIIDYIETLEDDELKVELTTNIIDFINDYFKKNYFETSNIFFQIGTNLKNYINPEAYIKLIKLRFDQKGKSIWNIPYETETLYFILCLYVTYPDLINKKYNKDIHNILKHFLGNKLNNKISIKQLITLYVKQLDNISLGNSYSNKFIKNHYIQYYQTKTLYYQSTIIGMIIYLYDYLDDKGKMDLLPYVLNLQAYYFFNYSYKLIINSKYYFETGKNLSKIFTNKDFKTTTVVYQNESISSFVENAILQEPYKNLNIFYFLSLENWFWEYFTKSKIQKDELIISLSETSLKYNSQMSKGFVKSYLKKIFLIENPEQISNIKDRFLKKRDILLPFFVSKKDEIIETFYEAFENDNKELITFLFRMLCGHYLSSGNVFTDFFIEGELIRSFFYSFFIEETDNYEKLYYSLPSKPINEYGYEEELRRNLINIHYHLFQSLPPKREFLYDLLNIYKNTLNSLLAQIKNNKSYIAYDRIEEEFSKISNLIYLINDNNIKFETSVSVYPLVKKYIEKSIYKSDYIFANYVITHIENPSPQLKWNILNYIKSRAFNYRAEIDKRYEKLFLNVDNNILLSYKDYLEKLLSDSKALSVPLTEYKVLLNILTENNLLKDKSGLDIMKKSYKTMYDNVSNKKLYSNNVDNKDIKKLLSKVKNLISYSSHSNDFNSTKENITHYTKEITSIFRNIIDSVLEPENIRLIVVEMAKEIIKLPIQDKAGVFIILCNVIQDYNSINNAEYKYYTTLIEYLIPDIFKESLPKQSSILSSTMYEIGLLIIYLYEIIDDENTYYNSEIDNTLSKFYSLLIMYSHYLHITDVSKEGELLHEYILGLYTKIKSLSLKLREKLTIGSFYPTMMRKEEEAIIATNLLTLTNNSARIYVKSYLKIPMFRRYFEEINDLDQKIIYDGTQKFISWISSMKFDYNNPTSNEYLIEILGIKNYVNDLIEDGYNNIEISHKILKIQNRYVSRLVKFFSETYGLKFTDPSNIYKQAF